MSNVKRLKMLSLYLITLCFVIVRGKNELPLDLDTYVCPENIRSKRDANCVLPKDTVTPINYKLELTPNYSEYNEETMTFNGEVQIQFVLEKSVPYLKLNLKSLRLNPDNFSLMTFEKTISDFTIKLDSECDFVHIKKSNNTFERGLYVFKIMYSGSIQDSLYLAYVFHGLIKASYKNNKNESRMFITTHVDRDLARSVFPCFDEPKYKATFQLIVHHTEKYKVISNMPILTQTLDTTEFMRTPLMPPDSLTFIICDLENISNSDNFTIHVRPDVLKYANFGLDTATRIFKAYEEYFDFRLKESFDPFIYKLDLVGLPEFPGRVSSFGVIALKEIFFIYDEQNPPVALFYQHYVTSIASAIAEQWFGNFASIKDWKYNWINDGLKYFLAFYISDKVQNNWRSMDQFVVDEILNFILKDEEKEEIPLENNNNAFSKKAPAIIHMMRHFLTESVFRKGLQLYLKKSKKNLVDSNDFLNALQDAAHDANININLKAVMKGWLEYPGCPVLNVTIDHDSKKMEITQKRFRSKDLSEEENVTNSWQIPINYATATKPDFNITTPDQWMKDNKTTINIEVKKGEWLILNKQVSGFYRINYSKDNWNLLIDYLKSPNREKIHVLNRAQLLSDAVAFVQQNTLELEIFLSLTAYLKDEYDYLAWLAASKAFEWLDSKLLNSKFHEAFKEGAVKSIKNWLDSLGYEEKAKDEHVIRMSRTEALYQSCKYGDPSCVNMMGKKLTKWFNATNNAENNTMPTTVVLIVCDGLQNATSDLWNKSLTLSLNTQNVHIKMDVMKGLGCSRNKTILESYLDFAFRDNSPLFYYTEIIVKDLYSQSEVAFDVVFEFVMEKYNIFAEKILRQDFVGEFFVLLAEKITTETNLKRLKETKLNLTQTVIDDAIGKAKKNMQWLEENEEKLNFWLKEFQSDVKPNSASIFSNLSSLFITLFYIFNMYYNFSFF